MIGRALNEERTEHRGLGRASRLPVMSRFFGLTISITFANATVCQSKISGLKFACLAAEISVGARAQLLRLAGAQGLVQSFEFISLSAEPGRRPDGRAVLAAHCDVRHNAADVPGAGGGM